MKRVILASSLVENLIETDGTDGIGWGVPDDETEGD